MASSTAKSPSDWDIIDATEERLVELDVPYDRVISYDDAFQTHFEAYSHSGESAKITVGWNPTSRKVTLKRAENLVEELVEKYVGMYYERIDTGSVRALIETSHKYRASCLECHADYILDDEEAEQMTEHQMCVLLAARLQFECDDDCPYSA